MPTIEIHSPQDPAKSVDAPRRRAQTPPPYQLPDGMETVDVGLAIRALRKQRGLTIRALAERCQINPNTLSLIENGHTSPRVHTLAQLARGLGVHVSALLAPEAAGQFVVYRRKGQRTLTRFAGGTIEDLGDGLPPLGAEPVLVTLETRRSRPENVSHAGREFVYCIEGEIACVIGETRYLLSAGDSLLFNADIPHYWENLQETPSRLLVLFCPIDADEHPLEQHLGR